MAALSARPSCLASRLRRTVLADAGTVAQVDRMVAAWARAELNQCAFTANRSRRADAMKALPLESCSKIGPGAAGRVRRPFDPSPERLPDRMRRLIARCCRRVQAQPAPWRSLRLGDSREQQE
jgi:hypothetical protein